MLLPLTNIYKDSVNCVDKRALGKDCQGGIMKVRPILPSVITRAIRLFETRLRAERGSRSSTIGVLVASVMWDAGNGCPFLFLIGGLPNQSYGGDNFRTHNIQQAARPRNWVLVIRPRCFGNLQGGVLPQATERDIEATTIARAAPAREHGIKIGASDVAAGNRNAQDKLYGAISRTAERATCGNHRKRASVLHYGSNYRNHNRGRRFLHRKEAIIKLNHYEKVNRLNFNSRQVQESNRRGSGENLGAEGSNQSGRK